ncbi:unnamed protein product, partial [marine sediment metagenome]
EHYDGGRTYMARWNRLKRFSGGLWIHKGSHDFDAINWLLEGAHPIRVSCMGNVAVLNEKGLPFQLRDGVKPGPNCAHCAYLAECPDVFGRRLLYNEETRHHMKDREAMFGDKAATIDGYHKDECMYLSEKDTHDHGFAIVEYDTGALAMHSECFVTSITDRRYILDGALGNGYASVHGNKIEVSPRWSKDRTTHQISRGSGGHGGSDPKMCKEFIECILKDRRMTASGIDGAWSVAIGQACELARAEARMVNISETLDADSDLLKG